MSEWIGVSGRVLCHDPALTFSRVWIAGLTTKVGRAGDGKDIIREMIFDVIDGCTDNITPGLETEFKPLQ